MDEISNVMDAIGKQFGDCKRKSGPEFNFIGINFVMKDGGVSVEIILKICSKTSLEVRRLHVQTMSECEGRY